MTADESSQLVVGTAGHIDHGKSRLVLALTGTDPDRLPEEKRRGMTIDLGFAHARIAGRDVHFVDVPGHERFIRHMVAGATGVDLGLLVVAADDGVMPQTREHAEVLRLAGVAECVVAVTKMDLVDDERGGEVAAATATLLGELDIAQRGTVLVSAATGRGLDELCALLTETAERAERVGRGATWFRLPVDRAFSVAGRGTVVTGTVWHGTVRSGEELELLPDGRRIRVRDLQSHHAGFDHAAGRMRLALNLAGVVADDIERGHEIATPGYLEPARVCDVWLDWLHWQTTGKRDRTRVRLHTATSEAVVDLRLTSEGPAATIRGAAAQLRSTTPLTLVWQQPVILRDESATRTIGGGRVLRPAARPWTARRPVHMAGLEVLRSGEPSARLGEVVRDAAWQVLPPERLATRAGLADASDAVRLLDELRAAGTIELLATSGGGVAIHAEVLRGLRDDLRRRFERHFSESPRSPGIPRAEWPQWLPRACPRRLHGQLTEWLAATGAIVMVGQMITSPERAEELSPADRELLDAILAEFHAAAFQPPAVADLQLRTPRNARRVDELVQWAVRRGRLIRVAEGILLDARRWRELVESVTAAIQERGGLTVADIRTLLNSTRKYVVPICEFLDKQGVTRRQGDLRVLGQGA